MVSWEAAVRAVHVLGAMLWLGGGLVALLLVMPTVQAAGPAGKGFMLATLRRGGWGRYFGPVSSVTIVAGLVLYWRFGYHSDPFGDLPTSLVTVGAIVAILAWVEAIAVSVPTENKLKKLAKEVGSQGPSPEQAAEFERLGAKQGKASTRALILVSLTALLMLARAVVL